MDFPLLFLFTCLCTNYCQEYITLKQRSVYNSLHVGSSVQSAGMGYMHGNLGKNSPLQVT